LVKQSLVVQGWPVYCRLGTAIHVRAANKTGLDLAFSAKKEYPRWRRDKKRMAVTPQSGLTMDALVAHASFDFALEDPKRFLDRQAATGCSGFSLRRASSFLPLRIPSPQSGSRTDRCGYAASTPWRRSSCRARLALRRPRFWDFGGARNSVRAGRKQSKAALHGALRRRPH
jgi:hypothetical protein